MLERSLKAHFSRSLAAHGQVLHFSAHSHHLWPDVSLEGQMEAWNAAASRSDHKWDEVYGTVIPELRSELAQLLCVSQAERFAFAPNTHEFVLRLLSCLPREGVPHVVSSDQEFYSFARQMERLAEDGLVRWTRVAAEPFESFELRWREALSGGADLAFLSQVPFTSGYAWPELASLCAHALDAGAQMVVDGYHGFCARPTDLGGLQKSVFYIGGGYKYAMSGEGACFLYVPDSAEGMRPRNTGWFAAFEALADAQTEVAYGAGAGAFWGATYDPSGLYRMRRVLQWMRAEGITPAVVNARARARGVQLVEALRGSPWAQVPLLVPADDPQRGSFLCFEVQDAARVVRELAAHHVWVDARGDRLRVGFGLYHDASDIEALAQVMRQVSPLAPR